MPNQTVKNSLDEIVPNEIFSQKENHVPIKKFLELIQSYQNVPFSGTKWPICREKFFLIQISIITSTYLLALFIVQNLQKFLLSIQSYEDAQFLDPKWSICPKLFFFENY